MNESKDRYSLCLRNNNEDIEIAKFSIEEIDNLTTKFENAKELCESIKENPINYEVSIISQQKLNKVNAPDAYFMLTHKYKNTIYIDPVLYKKDSHIDYVRKSIFSALSYDKNFIREVLFSEYNMAYLKNYKKTSELVDTINSPYMDISDARFQKELYNANSFLNYDYKDGKDNKKPKYKMIRNNYIMSLNYVVRNDLFDVIPNCNNYPSLKRETYLPKPSTTEKINELKQAKEKIIEEQLTIDFSNPNIKAM